MLNSSIHEDMVTDAVPKGQPGRVQPRLPDPNKHDRNVHDRDVHNRNVQGHNGHHSNGQGHNGQGPKIQDLKRQDHNGQDHNGQDPDMSAPKTGHPDTPEALVPRSFPAEQITFEKGLIGFSDHRDYGLMELPDERLSQFRLLQSMDDPDLSFLLLPLAIEGGPIAAEDLDKALKSLGVAKEDAVILAIVTVRKADEQFSVTANIRAPVVINLETRQGVQYVLANTDYSIRHPVG